MDISVIIVNYNVKYFLEQCLRSIEKSSKNLNVEIFVVDNNSLDGSCQMLKEKFSDIILIENKVNVGFARANNQAIALAKGKYVLVINPDTIVEELTLTKCFSFMEDRREAGCLGVKMIDGKGNFLPESKRALPTPSVAFYKISGLSTIFPKSERFGRYHLGFLNNNEINEIEVVAGAFMFIRKEALKKTGYFDGQFFMYGEDIDLSYRFIKAGYKNFYLPETTIIHYKGESTKKSSINYVVVFYNAMLLFYNKHFSHKNALLFSFIINTAIYLRAGVSIARRIYLNLINPILDIAFIYLGYYFILPYWEKHISVTYPPVYLWFIVPMYILIWMLSLYISGGFEKQTRVLNLIKGILTGTFIILIIYALLPENLRFSRALILFGTIWSLISTISVRYLLNMTDKVNFSFELFKKSKKIVLVGDKQESERVYNILRKTNIRSELIGIVAPDNKENGFDFIGDLSQIEEIVRINKADEIIFCAKSMSSQNIISNMLKFSGYDIEFKIASPESLTIIGSNSFNSVVDLYTLSFNSINKKINQHKKRIFDIILSLNLLILFPILVFFIKNPAMAIKNLFFILIGNFSFVGYHPSKHKDVELPEIKKGILTPVDALDGEADENAAERINIIYAKEYKVVNDLRILFKGLFKIGRKNLVKPNGKI